jgi:hypothetical protein
MGRWSVPWVGAESRLLSEWLAIRWPNNRVLVHVRVGRIPIELGPDGLTDAQYRMLGVWRRWADAVIPLPDRLLIVEAGCIPDPGDISQLQYYLRLAPDTPELAEFGGLPCHGHLLYGCRDPVVEQMGVAAGLTIETFSPAWLQSYLSTRSLRGLS